MTTIQSPVFPSDAATRNEFPMAEGLLYYFPNALAAVARVSVAGNKQHGLGPLHWARDVSTNHADKIMRHLVDAGTLDTDGTLHSAKVAWRALALLEDELIRSGAVPGKNTAGSPDEIKKESNPERSDPNSTASTDLFPDPDGLYGPYVAGVLARPDPASIVARRADSVVERGVSHLQAHVRATDGKFIGYRWRY